MIAQLAEILARIPEVRAASRHAIGAEVFVAHQADLLLHTWMVAQIHVHVVAQPMKLRDLKALVRANTRQGAGTLFLVERALLPAHEVVPGLPDWIEALCAMNGDFVYVCGQDGDSIALGQVHFTPALEERTYHRWQPQDFQPETANVRKRDIAALGGTCFVADITSQRYHRTIARERAAERFRHASRNTRPVQARPPVDVLQERYRLLGLQPGASQREAKSAYLRLARLYHPDVSDLPPDAAQERFKEIREAWDFIRSYTIW
jgi:hypothetical protein